MIVREYFQTRRDGVRLFRTYSDAGFLIRQTQTGAEYSEAVDVEDAPYTYAETDTPIPEPEGPETGDVAALEARLDAVESRLAALEEA